MNSYLIAGYIALNSDCDTGSISQDLNIPIQQVRGHVASFVKKGLVEKKVMFYTSDVPFNAYRLK